ncbi:GNAT family protein [Actinocorallia longicatena]|uniref:GNAT family protein n=1 Tax=Actinocorallia longicatena TaxID=111803 RepID=A0ABP6QIQ6_9ACTN
MQRDHSCESGRHYLRHGRFELRTPHPYEEAAAVSAICDDEAQKWLGWPPELVVPAEQRDRWLSMELPDPHFYREPPGSGDTYALVDREEARVAGILILSTCPDHRRWELGGGLAPSHRRRGFGAVLFRLGLTLAHEHYGLPTVHAGTEEANAGCCGSLLSAGFTASGASAVHRLPDGREVEALWFSSTVPDPVSCRRRRFGWASWR